jgi:hypothetical protein
MIMNNSRREAYSACGTLAYNQDALGLTGRIPAEPLLIGAAFHKAKQVIGSKAGNLDFAADAAEAEYRARANWSQLLQEELSIHEENISLVRSMVKAYGEHWINENYQILAPEVSFRVPIPNTEHHCWYFHKLLRTIATNPLLSWTEIVTIFSQWADKLVLFDFGRRMTGEDLAKWYRDHTESECDGWAGLCFQPHYLVGTTDAVIQWNRAVWLMEHKTTAYDLYNSSQQSKNWIANWYLSTQASTYIYGIWKSLGVRPHGVMLNVVIKPRKNAVTKVFNFYREAFLRTKEQLLRFESETARLMTDYEARVPFGAVWQDPRSCFNYNRKCDFHKQCVSGEPDRSLIARDPDYVSAAYYKVLGIESPTTIKESNETPAEFNSTAQ